jgi:phosphoglycerate dehydrogenase-like enzyme
MAQARFRVGITRDNIKPDGKPIFDEAAFKILQDAGIDYEFLPEIETELTPETAAKYDALAVMLAKVTRKTVSGPSCRLKLIARFGVGYDTVDVPACTENGVILSITLENIVVTPHHICLTDECINTIAASVFSACRDLAAGRVPKNVVNQEVLGKVSYFHR